ncbi:unnamed protein product [Scytosiphon promiscuus]
MTPEAIQRAYDWIEVREDLLARVSSLDPKRDANNKNIRPMYAHLLSALRRATITLIRVISEGCASTDQDDADAGRRAQGCFMWRGTNYLAKICRDTAFLDNVDELQRYFGVTFQDNPLVAEETLSGFDARVQHDSRGTRWDFPPRRRSFFAGLDSETLNFVHGVLRQAQKHEEGHERGAASPDTAGPGTESCKEHGGNDESPRDALPGSPTGIDEPGAKVDEHVSLATAEGQTSHGGNVYPHQPEVSRSADMSLVKEFALRVATAQAKRTALLASRVLLEWSSLAARLAEARAKVNLRYETREKVRIVARQRQCLVQMKKHAADKQRAREAASSMLIERRLKASRVVIAALATNLARGRALDRSARVLKDRVDAARTRREKARAMAALVEACEVAKCLRQKAEVLRAAGLTRMSLDAFCAWASAAGLAGRLRRRLGRADRALLENVLAAWALFSKHSVDKRRRKEERAAERTMRARVRAWDTEVIDDAFLGWANLTAATKFNRVRLSARALRGWAAVTRARASENDVPLQLSETKIRTLLDAAGREAEAMFERSTHKLLADFFESWAREAGLACRLRRRLGKADAALIGNAFRGWTMFARHAMRKRDARRQAREVQRNNAGILREVLWAWADVTAAEKFRRVRAAHRAFSAWRSSVGV